MDAKELALDSGSRVPWFGVSGLLIAEAAADAAQGRPVYWLPTFAEAEQVLGAILERGDVCLVMGAGDVDALGRRLVS